eukprot:m.230094 g.230094  ORF g.230094 m.230094 type:complete len:66 (+) comp33572_c0_seq2:225-422(+)
MGCVTMTPTVMTTMQMNVFVIKYIQIINIGNCSNSRKSEKSFHESYFLVRWPLQALVQMQIIQLR